MAKRVLATLWQISYRMSEVTGNPLILGQRVLINPPEQLLEGIDNLYM
jgi:hypothetical protein